MIPVPVDRQRTEQLNRASARKRCYPWDVVDWSTPIDDRHLYMPPEFSVFYDTPVWERTTFAQKSFLTRWEVTQFWRNAGVGEHMLNQALLAVARHTDPYHPAWRYMLHEVAEECQHLTMFNHWVRLNDDIRTKGANDDQWGLFVSVMTPVLSTRFPPLLWMMTLVFEVFGDDLNREQARNRCGRIHPTVQQIGRAHLIEEARHVHFARQWLAEHVPQMTRWRHRVLQHTTEAVTEGWLRLRGLPLPYSRQLADLVSYDEFQQARRSPHRQRVWQRQMAPAVRDMEQLGLLSRGALRRWDRKGLLPTHVLDEAAPAHRAPKPVASAA